MAAVQATAHTAQLTQRQQANPGSMHSTMVVAKRYINIIFGIQTALVSTQLCYGPIAFCMTHVFKLAALFANCSFCWIWHPCMQPSILASLAADVLQWCHCLICLPLHKHLSSTECKALWAAEFTAVLARPVDATWPLHCTHDTISLAPQPVYIKVSNCCDRQVCGSAYPEVTHETTLFT